MRLKLAIITAFLITVTLVLASHEADISMTPSEWACGTDADITLKVTNLDGSNIVKIEVLVPESDNIPLYKIKEISSPAGWTYQIRSRIGQAYPYKITWITEGTGIEKDSSLDFGFTAEAPKEVGKYEWKVTTFDKEGEAFVTTITSEATLAPLGYFKITAPKEVKAGEAFNIAVKVYDKFGKVKTDYTGTVTFSSTDERAILPKDYTFEKEDSGTKSFHIKLKTAGNQTITISDEKLKVSESFEVKVIPSEPTAIEISPDNKEILTNETIEFTVIAKDKYDNLFDVTEKSKFGIDEEADGTWDANIYTPGNEGLWTVTAIYEYNGKSLVDGATLRVKTGVKVEVPKEVEIANMSFSGPDSITISPGENETFILTVSNIGNVELSEVAISFEGVPRDWIEIYPPSVDIAPNDSKDFLVVMTLPENETESKTITFTSSSKEGITATKEVSVEVSTAPTGTLIATKNFLQLGVVIIAVAAVIIIVWELWFKKPAK